MILPDLNVLIHAHNRGSFLHTEARTWWESTLNRTQPVALPWVVILGFIRLSTRSGIFTRALTVTDACTQVRAWLAQTQVFILEAGPRHAQIFFGLLEHLGTAGNLTTDAHLAALAIEHRAELCSTDRDFSRFPGLDWRNPFGMASRHSGPTSGGKT